MGEAVTRGHSSRYAGAGTASVRSHCYLTRAVHTEDTNLKITLITAAAMLLLSASIALAQNANTGATTSSGDSAVSPATGNPVGTTSSSDVRPSPGAGVNSGALNNGTTGDTIGTGPGTTNRTLDGLGPTNPPAGGRKD
jgi:hypothetical protein